MTIPRVIYVRVSEYKKAEELLPRMCNMRSFQRVSHNGIYAVYDTHFILEDEMITIKLAFSPLDFIIIP